MKRCGFGRAGLIPYVTIALVLADCLFSPIHAARVTYTYDANGRLARAEYSSGEYYSYSYDPAGNPLTEIVWKDSDNDGIPDYDERGPAGNDSNFDGDGNGIPDSQEARVASVPTFAGGAYATLAVPTGQTLSNVGAVGNPSPTDAPSYATFPYGFFRFAVSGVTSGACTTATIFLPQNTQVNRYYKYGPEPGNATPHWYKFMYDGTTGAEIVQDVSPPRTRIVLHLCDGLRGDDDLASNGIIADQGGPAAMPESTLTVTKSGTGGGTVSATPPGFGCGAGCSQIVQAYDKGLAVSLSGTADPGSKFVGWSVGGGPTITVYMTTDRTITATFNLAHTITATPGSHGSISPQGSVLVEDGKDQAFYISANTGYDIVDVLVDGVSVGPVSSYTFTNVKTDHTISATFAVKTFTVTATAGPNGKITPSGVVTVNYGTNQTFYITPDSGYHADVVADGTPYGSVAFILFPSISANHTITANFLSGNYVINLPKTGQATSHAAGDDGAIQAGVTWPSPRFTNPDGTIPISGYVVLDQLTGLTWTKDGDAPGPSGCAPGATKTWQGALDYVSCLNSGVFLGQTDWRLPNLNELESLIHSGEPNTATWLGTQGFSSAQAGSYWSSTTLAGATGNAWTADLSNGAISSQSKTANSLNAWPVCGTTETPALLWRTGQTTSYTAGDDGNLKQGTVWPSPRFKTGTGSKAECITDTLTGLMWMKSPDATQRTWQGGVTQANDLDLCGYNDWHLPNRKELRSLIHYGQSNPAIWLKGQNQGFANLQAGQYWSSTECPFSSNEAWTVNLGTGEVGESALDALAYTIAVRLLPTLPPVVPSAGTIGTEITIRGSGFGAKKGKVMVGSVSAKVLTWKPDVITCLLSKVPPPEVYPVVVQPKDPKGADPITLESTFTVKIPQIGTKDPHGAALTEVTLDGEFFGTKKGKVALLVNGKPKSCKVTLWTMTPDSGDSQVRFVVPKGLAAGTYPLQLINGIGTATIDFKVD